MKVAKRYAKALFELSADQLETVQNDMQLIKRTFEENPVLIKVLKNPTVPASKKMAIVEQIFGQKVSAATRKLLQLLGQKDRLSLLQDIAVAFDRLYKAHKGIKEAKLTSAIPLTDDLKSKILAKVKDITGSNQIHLINTVDPSLIGGFILNLDDLRYDASVSGKLAKIKSKLEA